MPAIKCSHCGGLTNTALCNHLSPMRDDGKANECYARWKDGKWVKGCAYYTCDIITRKIVKRFLGRVK